jgi:hypothetical protein
MKSHFSHVVLIAGLTLFGSLSLNAQSKVNATVPFSFQADHATWPAGDYSLQKISLGDDGHFQLTDKTSGRSVFITAQIPEGKRDYSEGHLTFACSNGNCVLSQIAMPESNVAYARSNSAVEKDMQRKLGVAAMVSVKLTK